MLAMNNASVLGTFKEPGVLVAIILTFLILFFQYSTFSKSRRKLKDLQNFFPENSPDSNLLKKDENSEQILLDSEKSEFSKGFSNLLRKINNFIINNKGIQDFSTIRGFVDDAVFKEEESSTSNISLPIYIGLMGTIIGIITGLFSFAIGGEVSDKTLSSFISGVIVAMVASFFGLFFTVVNNFKNYKKAKDTCEGRKVEFLSFLQTYLFPSLQRDFYEALERLRTNINEFNSVFGKNIGLFDEKFSKNIDTLKSAVDGINQGITLLAENIKAQKEFIGEFRKFKFEELAKFNLESVKVIQETVPTLNSFIKGHKEFNDSIQESNSLMGKFNSTLDRINNFDESINNLGKAIDVNKFIGNDILNKIKKNLDYLDDQYESLKQHEVKSTDSINKFFEDEHEKISTMVQNIKRQVQEALDFNIENNPLKRLNNLETIDDNLKKLISAVNFEDNPFERLKHLDSIKGQIQKLESNSEKTLETMSKLNDNLASQRNGKRKDYNNSGDSDGTVSPEVQKLPGEMNFFARMKWLFAGK